MNPESRIYVAGHRGLVGSALVRRLENGGYRNIITRTHAELDLADQGMVRDFFETRRPDYVFLAAAKVGGIHANAIYRADFIYQNLAIQTNVINEAWRHGAKRLLFLGSSCIYPRDCPQPIREEYLLTGPLEPTNRPYALAKIAGVEMCDAYNRQHGTRFLSVMPTNCYGPGDNYDLQNSHVLPALIRKMHEAKITGQKEVVIWGTGRPRREFIYSDDLADACVFLMNLPDERFQLLLGTGRNDGPPPVINIGTGTDVTIAELARLVAEVVNYTGRIVYDTTKPDGTPRKLLDIGRLKSLAWEPKLSLKQGIVMTYNNFCALR